MTTLAQQINRFNGSLNFDKELPGGISVMNPFHDPVALELSKTFNLKYFSSPGKRTLMLGINPGRLGGGVTGIPFTDPVKMQDICGIPNDLKKLTEPSSGFIYDMISAYGGVDVFYRKFLIQAVCPLGFVRNGINYNYYDDRNLLELVHPLIVESLKALCSFQINTDICYCLGMGKNFRFLNDLNSEYRFFDTLIPLPHPRWIVQYRRKQYNEFINLYLKELT